MIWCYLLIETRLQNLQKVAQNCFYKKVIIDLELRAYTGAKQQSRIIINDDNYVDAITVKYTWSALSRILMRHPCMQLEATRMLLLPHIVVSFAVIGSDSVCPIAET